MIYARIAELNRYLGIHKNLDKAIAFLAEQGLASLHDGRNEVSAEDVFINVFQYDTLSAAEGVWEAHIQYADVHINLEGEERIGVADCADLSEITRREEEDFVGYEGPVAAWMPLLPGRALIVFPEDAHMVKIHNGQASHVRKAVVKVRM